MVLRIAQNARAQAFSTPAKSASCCLPTLEKTAYHHTLSPKSHGDGWGRFWNAVLMRTDGGVIILLPSPTSKRIGLTVAMLPVGVTDVIAFLPLACLSQGNDTI
jgi:hypothetical protein